jgi:hypothetical protein
MDHCRYDESSMQPVEGDLVDADGDLAELCARLREAHRGSCAIIFCDGEVLVEERPSVATLDRTARTSA